MQMKSLFRWAAFIISGAILALEIGACQMTASTVLPASATPLMTSTAPQSPSSTVILPATEEAINATATVTSTQNPTQTVVTPSPTIVQPTSVLSDTQLTRLVEAAAGYISPDPISADATVRAMNYAAGADASLTCGPLSIAILQDAGLLSPYLPLNDFWLSSPLPGKNEPIFREAFPLDAYEWKRDTTPMAEMDFSTDPLLPGDFIYTFGGNYEHMFTVTRVDEQGRAYTVQNLEQGYLNDDPNDTSFIIEETLLYDPSQPGIGMVYEWADDFNWKLGFTGTEGYMRFRPIVPIDDPSPDQIELANRIDAVVNAAGGKWNILIETLEGEPIYSRRPDESIHPASTIKVLIGMMTFEFLEQFGEGSLEQRLQRGPIYNILENDRSYEQLLRSMLVLSEEPAADILYENVKESPLNEYQLLNEWGLANTTLEPRKSTVRELNQIYRDLYLGRHVSEQERQYLLDWLSTYTANDELRLGRMNELRTEPILVYNKRGSLVAPQLIVADSGIAIVGDEVVLLQVFAYYDPFRPTTYEELEDALGELGVIVGAWLLDQSANTP